MKQENKLLTPAIINDIEYQVLKRNVGDTTIKHVFINFGGRFPKNYIQHINVTYPKRLYPNAKFTIRCNTKDINTVLYLQDAFSDRNINFWDDEQNILFSEDYLEADLLYCAWIGNSKYSNIISKSELIFHSIIHNFKGKVNLIFNDIKLPAYRDFIDVMKERISKDSDYLSKQKYETAIKVLMGNNSNFEKLSIVIQNNIMCQYPYWWNHKMQKINLEPIRKDKYDIEIISDIIFYGFPNKSELQYIVTNNNIPKGLFIGTCFKERIDLFEQLFPNKLHNLHLDICGANSEKINSPYASQAGRVPSKDVPEIFTKYDYGIYVARGIAIPFAGGSIYDPIIFKKPVFIYEPIDPEHLLMPGIDICYFNTAEELYNKTINTNFKELYEQQRDSLYERM